MFGQVHEMVTTGKVNGDVGKLAVFAGVHKYPARVKCAILSWHALMAALKGDAQPVTTESEHKEVRSRLPGRIARVLFTAGEGRMILLHGFIKKSQKTQRKIWNWRRTGCGCYNNDMNKEHIGSDFDDFLKQEGLLAECEAGALKRVVAWQLEQEMKRRRITRAKLASRMKTNLATLTAFF